MTGGRKTTLIIVGVIDLLIIVSLLVLRPKPGNTFDPKGDALKELPALGDKHVHGITDAPLAPLLLARSREVVLVEDFGRLEKTVAAAMKANDEMKDHLTKQARDAAQRVIDVAKSCDGDSLKGALAMAAGLVLSLLGLFVVALGLPKNGTLLVLLGGAAPAMAPNELAFVVIVPTTIAWVSMLVALAKD